MDGVWREAAAVAGGLLVVMVALLAMVVRRLRTPVRGTVLILKGSGPARVVRERVLILPVVHEVEVLDVAVHTLEVERRGREGLLCRDNIRVDARAAFQVRVNATDEDVLKVAETVGCARAGDHAALVELFADRFAGALQAAARELTFDQLMAERERFQDMVVEAIGCDLGGFVLDDVAVASLEQTPIEALDPNNIHDAEGIRRITERTAEERVRAAELGRRMTIALAEQQVRTSEDLARIEQEKARLAQAPR